MVCLDIQEAQQVYRQSLSQEGLQVLVKLSSDSGRRIVFLTSIMFYMPNLTHKIGANAMIGDINLTKGKALVAEVRRSIGNQNLYFLYLNVSDWQSQVDLFQAAAKLSTHESIDAIVTNTEVDRNSSTFESPLDNLGILEELPCIHLKALEVNLIEVIYTAHLALHYLPKSSESEKIYQPPTNTEGQDSPNRDRHIFLMGSMVGIFPMAAQVQYCTTKHAIVGFIAL